MASNSIGSVERAFRILEFVRENEPTSLTETAEILDVSKSTVHRYLSTLVSVGYLIKDDDGYKISFEFLSYANSIHMRHSFYPLIKRKVRELADESDELVQFTTSEQSRLVYLFKETGKNGLPSGSNSRTFRPLHSTAGGKAILSTWPRTKIKKYIEETGLDPVTNQTITDSELLFEELEMVRECGYAVNMGETIEGLGAMAVPIEKPDNSVIGALGISCSISCVNDEDTKKNYLDLLTSKKQELELNIRLS